MKSISGESVLDSKALSETEIPTKQLRPFRDISIWIDSYDDIFSDFDPRPYSERNISDDFLFEVKKVSHESDFHVSELKLLVPEKVRKVENEGVIVKRLQSHFRKNYHHFADHIKYEKRRGWLFALTGMVIMIAASYVSFIQSESFFKHVLFVVLEPAGWFLVWAGLDHLVYSSRAKKPELDFYNKLSKSKIIFTSI